MKQSVFLLTGLLFLSVTADFCESSEGPIAYYPMDGTAEDTSGNGHNGTVTGATAAEDRFGLPGRSLSFANSGDYAEVPHTSALEPGSITLLLWFKPLGPPWPSTASHLICKGYMPADSGYNLFIGGNGIEMRINDDAYQHHVGITPATGVWCHIAASYDEASGITKIYTDGQLVDSKSGAPSVEETSQPFIIGNYYTHGGSANGVIDDVYVFGRALSDTEIETHYYPESGFYSNGLYHPMAIEATSEPSPTFPLNPTNWFHSPTIVLDWVQFTTNHPSVNGVMINTDQTINRPVDWDGLFYEHPLSRATNSLSEAGTWYFHVAPVEGFEIDHGLQTDVRIMFDATGPVTTSSTHPSESTWFPNPHVNLSWSPNHGDSSSVDAYFYEWDHQSNTVPTLASPSITTLTKTYFNQTDGTWYFHIRSRDLAGVLSDTTHFRVNIGNQPPTADAGGPYTGGEGDLLNFDGSGSTQGDGGPLQYRWDFGDGSAWTPWRTSATTNHTYLDEGTGQFTLTLQVTNDIGISSDQTMVTISNASPTVDAGGPYPAFANESVSVTASGDDVGVNDVLEYRFDFGSGWSSWDQTTTGSHTYATTGAKTVHVEVRDGDGGTGTDTATVNVAPGLAAEANGPYAGAEGSLVSVTAADSTPGSGTALQYRWDFGDGGGWTSWSSSSNANHAYVDEGTGQYTVTLEVTNNIGADTDTAIVTVSNVPPSVSATLDRETVITGEMFTVTAAAIDAGTADTFEYRFRFGGVWSAWDASPAANGSYATVGTKTVNVEARDNDGGVGSTSTNITVVYPNRPPTAAVDDADIWVSQAGNFVTLNGTPSSDPDGDPLSYYWREMGDNPVVGLITDRKQAQIQVRPWWPGEYHYELIVEDPHGLQSDPVEVVLHVPGFVGKVFVSQTEKNALLPNAQVTVDGQAVVATCNDQGEFVVPAEDTWGVLTYRVNKDGYNEFSQSGVPVVYDARPVDINMEAETGNQWAGKVIDEITQLGIASVTLDIMPGSQYVTLTQGGAEPGRGEFSVENPPLGQHRVVLNKSGYQPKVFEIRFPDTTQPRIIELTPTATQVTRRVSGHVYAAGTTIPLVGVTIQLEGVLGFSSELLIATSDGSGAYEIPGVPVGQYRILASVDYDTAPDMTFQPYVNTILVLQGADTLHNIDMTGGVFGYFGDVLAPDGTRIHAATVAYDGPGEATGGGGGGAGSRYRAVDVDGTTDETGYFTLELPQGSRTVKVSAPGYQTKWVDVNMNGHVRQDVVMSSAGVDLDGDGLPDAWEDFYFPGTNVNPNVDYDSDGLTAAQELAAGTNPTLADSDGDGYSDGTEVACGSNPLSYLSFPGGALITSFHHNGQIGWMNADSNDFFTVEWAPRVDGPWHRNWQSLYRLSPTGETMNVDVPMFYRVLRESQ